MHTRFNKKCLRLVEMQLSLIRPSHRQRTRRCGLQQCGGQCKQSIFSNLISSQDKTKARRETFGMDAASLPLQGTSGSRLFNIAAESFNLLTKLGEGMQHPEHKRESWCVPWLAFFLF
jgi:hypothetical protein